MSNQPIAEAAIHRIAAAMVNRTSEAVLAVDAHGRVSYANPASHALLGLELGELEGRPIRTVLREKAPQGLDGGPSDRVHATLSTGVAQRLAAVLLLRHDGEGVQVDVRIDPLGDGGAVIALHDQADRRAVEWRLVSTASHELRSPLTSICGAMSVLESTVEPHLPPAERRVLAIAKRSVDRLVHHIERILEVNRLATGAAVVAPRPHDAQALVLEALDAVRGAAEARQLTLQPSGGPARLWGDEHLSVQALVVLLGHVLGGATAGSVITLHTETLGASVGVTVSARGSGLHPESLGRCLDAPRSIALGEAVASGLAHLDVLLCRELLERQGGRLSLESTPAEGSVFQLHWPSAPPDPMPRVLIGEVEPDVRAVMRALLERRGCEVGQLAMGMTEGPPDVLFLGEEQAIAILPGLRERPEWASVPVVLMGAHDVARPLEPIAARLGKPFTPAELARALEAALNARATVVHKSRYFSSI